MLVENVRNSSSGRPIVNQFIITMDDGKQIFQSYKSIIAIKGGDKVILDKKWRCTVTTGKYRNKFLGEYAPETARKVRRGIYIVADLNSKSSSEE